MFLVALFDEVMLSLFLVPMSAVITAVLIYAAFELEQIENLWTWARKLAFRIWEKLPGRKKTSRTGEIFKGDISAGMV